MLFLHFNRVGLRIRGLLTYYLSPTVKNDTPFRPTNHKFLISLTSSPERLKKGILETLRCFNGPVLINLPLLFHEKEAYDEDILSRISAEPNVIIHRLEYDLGPQTKMLGALSYYGLSNYDGIIVLDDDTLYDRDMVNKYDDDFDNETILCGHTHQYFGIQLAPGCHSFCVPSKILLKYKDYFLDGDKKYSNAHMSCRRHDDMIFGAIFQDLGLQIKKTTQKIEISQLDLGYGFDALHNVENNASKHVRCSEAIWDLRAQCSAFKSNAADLAMKVFESTILR